MSAFGKCKPLAKRQDWGAYPNWGRREAGFAAFDPIADVGALATTKIGR